MNDTTTHPRVTGSPETIWLNYGDLERDDTHAIERKKAKVLAFMEYAEQCGTLTPNASFSRGPSGPSAGSDS